MRYFEISLDSVDPAKHDAFRGVTGAWERTVAGIKNVVAQDGVFSCIANTITNENYRELDALVEFSRKLGVNRTLIFNFIPVGRGADIIDMDLPPDAREHVLQQMYGYLSGQDESFEILTTAPQFSRVCMMNSQNGIISLAHVGAAGFSDKVGLLAEYIGGCGAGRMYLRYSAQRNRDTVRVYADTCRRLAIRIFRRHLEKLRGHAVAQGTARS